MSYDIGKFAVAAISVILSGLIAGQMLAIAVANHAARRLPETSWALRFQVEDKLFTKTMIGRLIFWIGNHVREGPPGRIPDQSDRVPRLARLGRQRRRAIGGEDDLRAVTREQWAASCSNIRSTAPVRHRAEIGAV
jgi:hypothetical protein